MQSRSNFEPPVPASRRPSADDLVDSDNESESQLKVRPACSAEQRRAGVAAGLEEEQMDEAENVL